MTTQPYRPTGVRFGAAYYLEYQPTDDPIRDRFLHNWSDAPAAARVPAPVVDLVSGARHPADQSLALGPWSCLVLADPA